MNPAKYDPVFAVLARIAALLAALFMTSCGGGGGGGSGGDTYVPPLTVTSVVEATVGQKVAIPSFLPLPVNAVWDVLWVDKGGSGSQVAASAAVSLSSNVIAIEVPATLETEEDYYLARLMLEDAEYMTVGIQPLAPPVVADPAAYIDDFEADLASSLDEMAAAIAKEQDPALRELLQADFLRMQSYLSQFSSGVDIATPEELQAVALQIAAYRQTGSGVAGFGDVIDPMDLASEASRDVERAGLKLAQAVLLISAGVALLAPPSTVVGLGSILLGMQRVLEHRDILVALLARGVAILDFTVQSGVDSGQIVMPPCGGSVSLSAVGNFSSISRSLLNTSIPLELIQAINGWDSLLSMWRAVPDQVRQEVQLGPVPLPSNATVFPRAISWNWIRIAGQSNSALELGLSNSMLSLRSVADSTSAQSSMVTFELSLGVGPDRGPLAMRSQVLVTVEAGASSLPSIEGMVRIEPGSFVMGSEASSQAPYFAFLESPRHVVRITRPFLIGRYEVTQQEFEEVMGVNPSRFVGPRRPVETVSWITARQYCESLTVREHGLGRLPACFEYRLPTEAEWEYCCRAGSGLEYYIGDIIGCGFGNYNRNLFEGIVCGVNETRDVGQYPANPWGLFDMGGNVAEMTLDAGRRTYRLGLPDLAYNNPVASGGVMRVVRGGSYAQDSEACRSAHRGFILYLGDPAANIGFRVCVAPR